MFPKPNEHGSYPDEQAERIEYRSGKAYTIIRLLQVGDNAWIQSANVQYAGGGMSEPLSKFFVCETRQEAITKALKRVESYSKNYAPRVSMWAAQQSVHPTAFGVQLPTSYPLQLPLFVDDLSATYGGG
jgi:hypothetical protein